MSFVKATTPHSSGGIIPITLTGMMLHSLWQPCSVTFLYFFSKHQHLLHFYQYVKYYISLMLKKVTHSTNLSLDFMLPSNYHPIYWHSISIVYIIKIIVIKLKFKYIFPNNHSAEILLCFYRNNGIRAQNHCFTWFRSLRGALVSPRFRQLGGVEVRKPRKEEGVSKKPLCSLIPW